ncbi:hypothetical protein KMZ29_01095 [Bradyrhizobium sediminis]|uniref:Uncharacterized protein n=1 Tax=Bradyrhizobium sediminis TaxID=2840469 RepID=A0A975RMF8_9BRAD|nr:hypothetical protein [Bradyrhizobium sediminis]QWG13380.1 hypothetical protein KMZ29_01095 [Bradyrhizobium sediminis]
MGRTVSDISLDHLLVDDQKLISNISEGSAEEAFLLAKTREFLAYWSARSWLNTEAIEIVGAKLSLSAAPAVWEKLRNTVANEFPQLSMYFLKFSNSREMSASPEASSRFESKTQLPSIKDLNSLAAQIEEGRVSEIASGILSANDAYSRSLSSERSIILYLSFLAKILGRLSAKSVAEKTTRAKLIHHLSREFLKWEPWNEKPWTFLMHGYLFEGAYREAESVIWEALRRFNSPNAWVNLINYLSKLSDRADDYYYYSGRAESIVPGNSYITANRIRAILRKGDMEELPIACDLAGKMFVIDPNFHEANIRLFLNSTLLLFQQGRKIDRFIKSYAPSVLRAPNAISSLVWMAQNFRCAAQFGTMLLSVGLTEEPTRVDYLDHTGLLKVILGGAALDEAIEQATWMIEKGFESATTRNWLAMALIKRNGGRDRDVAKEHLIANINKFPMDQVELSRALLAKLNQGRFDEILAKVSPKNREVDVSRIRGVGEDHFGTVVQQFSESVESQYPLPKDIWRLGTLKRISILLFDEGPTGRHTKAISELETMRREVGTSSNGNGTRDYIDLLIARADKDGAHEKQLPAFAAKFEYALNRGDRELLQQISRDCPRLSALSLIARAMFGDVDAAAEVGRYLRRSAGLAVHEKPFHDELLRRTFGGDHLSIDDGKIVELFQANRRIIEPIVRMANEALVYLPAAA